MNIENSLKTRSGNKCELCEDSQDLAVYTPSPREESDENSALICHTCSMQIDDISKIEVNRWHCLNGSIWSEYSPVKVLSWRMLNALSSEGWAQDLLEQIYLDDSELEWAKYGLEANQITVKDSNGAKLVEGDSVTLIKDLDVKGAGFTAKRGTLVKRIRLTDNPLHIEGKVNGTMIVLVSAYLKKV